MKFTKVQLESKVEQQYTIFRLFTKPAPPTFPLYPHQKKASKSIVLAIDLPKEQILDCLFK